MLASIFAKFDVFFADPGYTLQIKQALTIKPKEMRVKVALRSRPSSSAGAVEKPLKGADTDAVDRKGKEQKETVTKVGEVTTGATPLYVFYGSNTGTSEGFAGRVASDAAAHGTLSTHPPSGTPPTQNSSHTDMYPQASKHPSKHLTSRPPTYQQTGLSS